MKPQPTYVYRTRLCDWVIRPAGDAWELLWQIPDGGLEVSGRYSSLTLAADDVATGHTGFDEWDNFQSVPPEIEDISNWRKVANYPQPE